MPRKTLRYILEENYNDFSSLSAIQRDNIQSLSEILAKQLSFMLENGDLVVENGIILPANKKE